MSDFPPPRGPGRREPSFGQNRPETGTDEGWTLRAEPRGKTGRTAAGPGTSPNGPRTKRDPSFEAGGSDTPRAPQRKSGGGQGGRSGGGGNGGGGSGGKRTSPPARKGGGFTGALLRLALMGLIWGTIGLALLVLWYGRTLPDIERLQAAKPAPTLMIVSADGETLAVKGDAYGRMLDFGELPPHLIHALMATEDRRFYDHWGVDPIGVGRAVLNWATRGGRLAGGSTLTQQLAKNIFLTPERTPERKIQELLLAFWLEHRYSKDEILALYLNRVHFGAGTYGIEAASQLYFGKQASEMSLQESAMMVGLLKRPSKFAPTNDLNRSRARAAQVLDNMADAGFITLQAAEDAKREPASPVARAGLRGTQYFVDWILNQLPDYIGRPETDIKVITTLDSRMQVTAEQAVTTALDKDGAKLRAGQAALLSITPDGAVKAMVGGRAYSQSQYNHVTDAQRQPGSAFKPFVYIAALDKGYTPDSPVVDAPVTIGRYSPQNYTGKYLGEIKLSQALAESINTVAVRLADEAGLKAVIRTAQRMGITTAIPQNLSIALGTAEVTLADLTAAYAPFASNGNGVFLSGIERIENGQGQALYQRGGDGPGPVLPLQRVAQMNKMLEEVVWSGTGKAARLERRLSAGKTGTTQSYRDAWFMGFTADLVTGVWVGNDDGTPMKKVTGGGLPAQIWKAYMTVAAETFPPRDLPRGDGFEGGGPSLLTPREGAGSDTGAGGEIASDELENLPPAVPAGAVPGPVSSGPELAPPNASN